MCYEVIITCRHLKIINSLWLWIDYNGIKRKSRWQVMIGFVFRMLLIFCFRLQKMIKFMKTSGTHSLKYTIAQLKPYPDRHCILIRKSFVNADPTVRNRASMEMVTCFFFVPILSPGGITFTRKTWIFFPHWMSNTYLSSNLLIWCVFIVGGNLHCVALNQNGFAWHLQVCLPFNTAFCLSCGLRSLLCKQDHTAMDGWFWYQWRGFK